MKPKLVDYSLFVEKKVSVKPLKKPNQLKIQNNDFNFLINIIILLISLSLLKALSIDLEIFDILAYFLSWKSLKIFDLSKFKLFSLIEM